MTQVIKGFMPLKRLGETSDVAHLVEFLTSDKVSFITGQGIFVDGGVSVVGHEFMARRLMGCPRSSQEAKD